MIELQTITVQLGEREYVLTEAPRLRAKPWRARFMAEVRPVFAQVGQASSMTFETPADLMQVVPLFETLFTDAIDKVAELVLSYAPELEQDRAYIEEHATDRQLLAAFGEMVRLADPFGVVGQLRREIGRQMIGTLSSSRQRNGVAA